MNIHMKNLLKQNYKISDKVINYLDLAEKDTEVEFKYYDEIKEFNQAKVLVASA